MKGLLFMARLALLCNVCYVLYVLGRYISSLRDLQQDVVSTIAVLAVVGVFLNAFVNIAWLISIAFKKKGIPNWLGIVNLLFLIFQILNISFFQL